MRLPLLLCAALALNGCRFWYKPVPVANAIGEEQVVLPGRSDTVHVYRERRFEVYAPNSEAVYDGYEQLNRAYRAFERHFGVPAAHLAFVLYPDSVIPLGDAARREFRSRGFTVVEYARPRSVRTRRRYTRIDYGGVLWPIAPTAARVMLARFAESAPAADVPASDSTRLERFPAWFRAAVFHLVGEAGSFVNDLEYVREKRNNLWTFRDLVSLVRPATADSLLDPSRRGEADEATRIFAAQASTLGRYLVEREGHGVLGRIARGYLASRSLPDMIAEFKHAPRTAAELENRWKIWIDTVED